MIQKTFLITVAFISATFASEAQDPQLGKDHIDKVVEAMTLDEKALLLVGAGMPGFGGDAPVVGQINNVVPGAAGATYAIKRLGIPSIVVADGPAGLRIAPSREGSRRTYYCTAFPAGTLLASTWNTQLAESVGGAMGNEVLEYGVDILLGPALNIQRNPLCGRNFEYYSEDPLLSGAIASAMVRGIQSNGVGTSVKHFAVNNQESNRMGNDSRLTPRALREIYLKGFEITVKESSPWTIMSSYNFINGTYASESRELLTDILRNEWGFKGVVMTDWFGGKSAPSQVYAGNDLMMPGTQPQYRAIVNAVNSGSLSVADVNSSVKRMLTLIMQTPRFKQYKYSDKPDLGAHANIARRSATEGMVLLKNNGNALPLGKNIKQIAAFGITSYDFIAGGTGSGDVNEAYTVSLKDGLTDAGYGFNAQLASLYEKYIEEEKAKVKVDADNPLAMFFPKDRAPELTFSAPELSRLAAETDMAIITIGRNSGEFSDRKLDNDFNLSDNEISLIKNVCSAYQSTGKKAVVILNIGGVIETSSWKDLPDAILLAWQAGQEGGNSVADILSGKANPSGKLPITFPVGYFSLPSANDFPYEYVSTPPVLFAETETVKGEPRRNVDYTNYNDDIYVGYRYFNSFGGDVSYPFGYGLSYTRFDITGISVSEAGGSFAFNCTVTNKGTLAGKEVVQLYVSAPGKSLNKPVRELKAFAKTNLLQPGESQAITLKLSGKDLASFDETISGWAIEAGQYSAYITGSPNDIGNNRPVSFNIAEGKTVELTGRKLLLREELNVIKP
jgi:beta-glucosidase